MKPAGKAKQFIYGITLFVITLSGFAQMPIFKRYYIADIPGLGWLAEFYVTHIIHYTAATVLIALASYIVFDFIFKGAAFNKITGAGYFKLLVLIGLIISGTLMVIKNLPDVYLGHTTVIFLDLAHLSLCMMLLFASLYAVIRKRPWIN